jgi:dTDP-4-dehydrorhamnose reductase
MKALVIGRKGFLSKFLINQTIPNALFISEADLNNLTKEIIDSIQKVVVISFDQELRDKHGNSCRIEKKILKTFNPEKVLIQYLSTSKVYPNLLNISEDHDLAPNSFYAENKIIAEQFIQDNFKNFHIFRTANLFNIYGGAPNTFIDNVIKNLSVGRVIFDVSEFSCRDFISTKFIAELITSTLNPESGIYNTSSSIALQIFEIINVIASRNSLKIPNQNVQYGTKIVNQTLNNTKLLKAFSYNQFNKTNILKEMGEINAK